MAEGTIEANGVRFAYLEAGSGPLVLCLHGFPDTAYTFSAQLDALADAGYRAVAPFMRGYPPTAPAPDGDYGPDRLGEDVLALIEAFGAPRASVVGHDWGAVAAYMAAALGPERIERMVTAAVPHLGAFRRNVSLAQLRRSWYMMFFQIRGVAERAVRRRDGALIERLWRDWSPSWQFTDEQIRPIQQVLATDHGLAAALGYYRATFSRVLDRDLRRIAETRLRVPTLTCIGAEDGCVGPEMFAGSERFFEAPVELQTFVGAGHFMHGERPAEFNERMLEFLGRR